MIHLDIAVGQKNLTPTPSVFRKTSDSTTVWAGVVTYSTSGLY